MYFTITQTHTDQMHRSKKAVVCTAEPLGYEYQKMIYHIVVCKDGKNMQISSIPSSENTVKHVKIVADVFCNLILT